MQGADIITLLTKGTFDYPYYFIGVDIWFAETEIQADNLLETNALVGSLGTMPFYPAMLSWEEYQQYHDGNKTIYDKSTEIYNKLINEFRIQRNSSSISVSPIMPYAYDAVYALAYALHIYDQTIDSLKDTFANCSALNSLADDLREILINMPGFIGTTGFVEFDENGDRKNAKYVYGLILPDNKIQYVTIANLSGECDHSYLPQKFQQWETCPQYQTSIVQVKQQISLDLIGIIGGVYILVIMFAIYTSYQKRNDQVKAVYYSMTTGLFLC